LSPRFELRSYDDMPVVSDELLKAGPLVLTFYRGLWCPYCQKDLRDFVQLIDEASELNNCVLAISRPREPGYDRPRDHELGLNFPVLEDASGNLAVQYGIRWPAEDARLIERALGWDLLTFRGTEPWINPMQARFIIDRDGRIAFAEIAFNYEERTNPANLVPLLAQLRGACQSIHETSGVVALRITALVVSACLTPAHPRRPSDQCRPPRPRPTSRKPVPILRV
jgi:peroxiredoxin